MKMLTTPFHERTSAANETGLWSHWAGHLVVTKYQINEKVEYFALRNAAGVLDTSALFKYRIYGRDAERLLSGVLARDIRKCRPGKAQYTMWCDDRGFLIEDGVVLRTSSDEFLLTSAEPNLAYLESMIGGDQAAVEDITDHYGILAVQGPASRTILSALAPEVEDLSFFALTPAKIGDASVIISRTGYTGDLGYEIWADAADATDVWDAVTAAGTGRGLLPYGSLVMHMARIEAGLLLIDVDYQTSRFAWIDEQRATPIELGYGWMFKRLDRDDRAFVGRGAIERELADGSSRFRLVGLDIDWRSYQRAHLDVGLPPTKDHVPVEWAMMVYDDARRVVGHASSFLYSPLLQRHIAIARLSPALAAPGTRVRIEVTINNLNYLVDAATRRLPFFNPARKTA
ncbi:MAG: aminomethyl transferase family protein [Acidobacteria bacterium]|nr:aminomethyl transferase family protein [Acidobacteriota bacterium]